MNVFEEIHHRLSSKTRIRSLFKDVHVEDLERIISRMQNVLEEKVEARNKIDEERQAKLESIEAVKQIMAERGISMEDLDYLDITTPKRRRNVQRFTFEYQTEAGDTVHWDGSTTGRLPSDFQDYLNRTGKKRLECVVNEE
ncbi:H-NS family nucleoid-associated regulatory protein [Endozoicomonas sp. 4G]|uniref:H-NS family histone-like protein n=1 Tax=Endozoicomonas sp. 4G TaxID=2872754 RepID=UPI002078A94D|nr:H-NS family nucleoid-associated regulatory protein [Endozoicomonas sp. 4G]